MARKHIRYAPEFRQQMVELYRAGRDLKGLSKEFGCSGWSIRLWEKRSARDAGTGDGGLTSAERQEVKQLRAQVRHLKEERDILSKAAAWFATESSAISKRSSGS